MFQHHYIGPTMGRWPRQCQVPSIQIVGEEKDKFGHWNLTSLWLVCNGGPVGPIIIAPKPKEI
jgi:hypothetical protein